MNTWTKHSGLLAVGVLTTGLLQATPATAAQYTTTATACRISAGAMTAQGDHRIQTFAATKPITRTENRTVAKGLWPAGLVRLSSSWFKGRGAENPDIGHHGLVVDTQNTLYDGQYAITSNGGLYPHWERIGGGWGGYRAIERSQVLLSPTTERQTAYGLAGDGTLHRWNITSTGGRQSWKPSGTAGGYAGVKSMALISQTKTYDTFLMNGKDGALLTVHIPTTSPMKPVVKKVRTATWQGFEAMMGARCGTNGTLLLGIDKDTGAGYLYAVGHGATVIQGLGKAPGTFADPVPFAWHENSDPKLFGE
ncbi:hypothetical protein PWY87_25285 [Kribbella solani]|uniref:hypothetical protein n=1 Tax=Kribbella solani TaxID=236067 RepID=UPI0029BA8DBA|nr:hypothetical protein [Kribbella solani]MDX2968461.1 hypothetical protein [Kribbella solani]MDX3005015.1 hypothetical protein [Kribbella solani]